MREREGKGRKKGREEGRIGKRERGKKGSRRRENGRGNLEMRANRQ